MRTHQAIAALCYLLALAGAGCFGAFVLLLGCDLLTLPPASAHGWLVDLGWVAAFTLQHSGMARTPFKRQWTRWVPPRLERSVYGALSGGLLLALPWVWQVVPGPVLWQRPLGWVVVPLTACVGLAFTHWSQGHAGLFGLRQAWAEEEPERLVVHGPYRFVRHPLMAFLLVFLWAQPTMTPTLALLAGGLTAAVLLGIVLEERDLSRRFHPHYAHYRRRVPALVPWRFPPSSEEGTTKETAC